MLFQVIVALKKFGYQKDRIFSFIIKMAAWARRKILKQEATLSLGIWFEIYYVVDIH